MRAIRRNSAFTAAMLAGNLIAILAGSGQGHAQQAYPSKAITIIVPAAAGGPTDAVARLIGESMGRTLGQQIVVEKSAPDGYTLAVWHIAQATAPTLYDNLRYNVIDDFDSIGRITDVPMTIVGKANHEAKNIAELLAWVKQKQATATYAHAGVGSASYLCALMFMSTVGTQMTATSTESRMAGSVNCTWMLGAL